jgi:hypothetical protein
VRGYYLGADLKTPVDGMDVSGYLRNNKWSLLGKRCDFLTIHLFLSVAEFSATNNDEKYDCCPEIFQNTKVIVKIRRSSTYYSKNITGTKSIFHL